MLHSTMVTANRSGIVDRGDRIRAPRILLLVLASAVVGAIFLATIILLAGCSGSVAATLRADGGARVSVGVEIPAPLAAKFRKLSQAGSGEAIRDDAPLFDLAAIRTSAAERPGIRVSSLSRPTPESIKAEFDVLSLDDLAADKKLAGSGFLKSSKGPGWRELAIRLDRASAAQAASLFPGIDPYLMEALSPPALEEDPVNAAEYRLMLKSVLGEKAMPAMEAAAIRVSLSAPGAVLDAAGGSLSGRVLSVSIPIIDALVLERPIEIRLRWET